MATIDRSTLEKFSTASISLKNSLKDPTYVDLWRKMSHDRLTGITRAGGEVDENMLEHIRMGSLRRIWAYAAGEPSIYDAQREAFDNEIWPMVCESAKKNSGMTQFLLENGIHSDFILKFLYNVRNCPAKAVLPAHGVSDTLAGDPEIVTQFDPMWAFLLDPSYTMIQYRTEVAQEAIRKAEVIFFAGGGLLPELWAGGYLIGDNGQRYVVWDQDPTLPEYLEKILGGKLEDFGIEYHIGDYREAFKDEAQQGVYDCVVANGIMAYTISKMSNENDEYDMTQFTSDMRGFYGLLGSGGNICFDVQLFHPVLLFDIAVLNWPTGMTVISSFQKAVELVNPILEEIGYIKIECTHEAPNAEFGEAAAGMITAAQKSV